MAHKTKVNGTNYEISGGKTLVNGTAYSIDKGKTLVGGTAYEVGFVALISFTVKPSNSSIVETYYAEEGMTWSDFINSDYNPVDPDIPSRKWFRDDGYGTVVRIGSIRYSDFSPVELTEQITSGYQYMDYIYID